MIMIVKTNHAAPAVGALKLETMVLPAADESSLVDIEMMTRCMHSLAMAAVSWSTYSLCILTTCVQEAVLLCFT